MRRPPTTAYNPPPTTQGIFSSLPLSFFSTSVPSQVIRRFTSNGGNSLPHPIPPNLFISEFNDKHPFYKVDLFFIAGPSDPLMTLLQRRTLVLYDCEWVEESVKRGEMVPLDRHVLAPERIKIVEQVKLDAEKEGEEGKVNPEGDVETREDEIIAIPTENQAQISIPIDRRSNESSPLSLPDTTSIHLGDEIDIVYKPSDRLINLPTVYVARTAFLSQDALVKSVLNRPTSVLNNTPGSPSRSKSQTRRPASSDSKATAAPRLKRNAKAGPSRSQLAALAGDSRSNDEFIPFQPSSTPTKSHHLSSIQVMQQSTPSPPILRIPFTVLDEKKVGRFMRKFEKSVQCELDDVYVKALEGEYGGYKIMGLEEGSLD